MEDACQGESEGSNQIARVKNAVRYHAEGNCESSASEFRKAKDIDSFGGVFQYCEAMSYHKSKVVDNLANALDLLTAFTFSTNVL